MRASNTYNNSGSNVTKIAIVTALHIGAAFALLNMRGPVAPPLPPYTPEPITDRTVTPPPQPPVEVADTTTKKILPTIFVPPPEVITIAKPPVDTPTARPLPPGPLPEIAKDRKEVTDGGPGPDAVKKPPGATPIAQSCARPDYPASAARNGESGTVNLALLIGANGHVTDAKVERSSGSRVLDRAAIAALSICKFTPATNNGVAEPAWGKIAYVWSLD